jgi:SAM-dependent methyltransferase
MTTRAPRPPTDVFGRLRAVVPESVAGALANCGGTNRDGRRFAGRLLDPSLTEDEYLAICHALIFPNGVRKTTRPQRNADILRTHALRDFLSDGAHIRVLDIGASVGLDAVASCALLRERYVVDEYCLGDLHTGLLYDRQRGLVFDEDGQLLQVLRGRSFVSMNFAYNYAFQRVTSLPKRLRPWVLGRGVRSSDSRELIPIPLFHPGLGLNSAASPFTARRMDVFAPIEDSFDLIICMHLLVPRYFSKRQIDAGVQNLARALRVQGTLVAGATERFRVVRRVSADHYETKEVTA